MSAIGLTTERIWNITQMDNATVFPLVGARRIKDPHLELMRYVCEVGLNLPISCLGIIGNIIAFVVLCNHKQKISANVLLQGLAVSDTLILLSTILLRCLRFITPVHFHWEIYIYLYRWGFPSVFFFRLTNTWLTVLLTIDRYIAVCHPLRAQHLCNLKRTYILMVVVTLASATFSIPRFFEYQIAEVDGQNNFQERDLIRNAAYTLSYRITCFFIFMYFVPMFLLVVLNGLLLHTIRKANVDRVNLLSHSHAKMKADTVRSNRSITMIVVAVVLICITCNTTAMIAHVLWSLSLCIPYLSFLDIYRRYLANVSNVLVTINCAINFVVYCVFSRNFRALCARMFHCNKTKGNCLPLRKYSSKRSQSGETADTLMLRSISKDKGHRVNANVPAQPPAICHRNGRY